MKTIETVEIWVDGKCMITTQTPEEAVKVVRETICEIVEEDPRNSYQVELRFEVAAIIE